MVYPINQTVEQVGKLRITGNVVPMSWFSTLKKKTEKRDPKPYLLAIMILSDIVYWYRPVEIRDEATGTVVQRQRKFKSDKFQRSSQQYAEMFGVSQRQASDALSFLVDIGVISLEYRSFITDAGVPLSNVQYIELIPERLRDLTYPDAVSSGPSKNLRGVSQKSTRGLVENYETCTDTSTEISTPKPERAGAREREEDAEMPEQELQGEAALTAIFGPPEPKAAIPAPKPWQETAQEPWAQAGRGHRITPRDGVGVPELKQVIYLLESEFKLEPDWDNTREKSFWLNECARLWTASRGDLDWIRKAGRKLDEDERTISSPKSFYRTVTSMVARADRAPTTHTVIPGGRRGVNITQQRLLEERQQAPTGGR